MVDRNERSGLFSIDKAQRRRLVWMLVLLAVLSAVSYRMYHPRDPLAELKRTERTGMNPEAQAVIDKALKAIEANELNKLSAMMRMQDSIGFRMNYAQGIFRKEAGAFTPARVVSEPKMLVKSTWGNMFVKLYSEPRNEDYWISLVRVGDQYRISEIVPTSVCKGL